MFRLSLVFLTLAFPALAHEGGHLHPHGVDLLWAGGLAALLLLAGYVIGRGRK